MNTAPKEQYKSYNSSQLHMAKDLLLPRPLHAILYLVTCVVLLAAMNSVKLWEYLNHDPRGQANSLRLFGSGDSGGILGSSTTGRVGQMLVWGLFGVVMYVAIWFLKNIITNLRNDIMADEYVHPHSYNRTKYWKSVITRKILFTSIVLVLLAYIYLIFQVIPLLTGYFYTLIISYNTTNAVHGILAVLSSALLLHIFLTLGKLTIRSWRFIYADL